MSTNGPVRDKRSYCIQVKGFRGLFLGSLLTPWFTLYSKLEKAVLSSSLLPHLSPPVYIIFSLLSLPKIFPFPHWESQQILLYIRN